VDQRQGALIGDEKRALRASLRERRDALSVADRAAAARRITDTLLALPAYRSAQVVLAYMSLGTEFDTSRFTGEVIAHGKTLLLPRVNRTARQLDLYVVNDIADQLAPGVWNILEPIPARCQPAAPERIDFALVPGLAFDAYGGRLGYGGGFYDRLLVSLPRATSRVAAAFAVQLVAVVPMGERDQYVDLIVTEDGPIPAQR
jgi:5-formyltetrahydrofolate cyclo-ligase